MLGLSISLGLLRLTLPSLPRLGYLGQFQLLSHFIVLRTPRFPGPSGAICVKYYACSTFGIDEDPCFTLEGIFSGLNGVHLWWSIGAGKDFFISTLGTRSQHACW